MKRCLIVILSALLACVAVAAPPATWPGFTAVAQIQKHEAFSLINAPLHAVSKIAQVMKLKEANSAVNKDHEERQCDYVIGVRKFVNDSGLLLVVTNGTGQVPQALFDMDDGIPSPFADAAEGLAITTVDGGAHPEGVWFRFSLVCALLPLHSSFKSQTSMDLPIVFPPTTTAIMEHKIRDFSDSFANGNVELPKLSAELSLGVLNQTAKAGFVPMNASDVVPWTSFAAIATRQPKEDSAYVFNAPLRSLDLLADFLFTNRSNVNSPQQKAADGNRTCNYALGVVRPSESNTVAIVTDSEMEIPASLTSTPTSPSVFAKAVKNDVKAATNAQHQNGSRFTWTIVCVKLDDATDDFSTPESLIRTIAISNHVEATLNHKYNAQVIQKVANGALNNTELEAKFKLSSMSSGEFFPQNLGQRSAPPPPTQAPATPGSNPNHLTTGGVVAIVIAVAGFTAFGVYFLRKRQRVLDELVYEEVKMCTPRV